MAVLPKEKRRITQGGAKLMKSRRLLRLYIWSILLIALGLTYFAKSYLFYTDREKAGDYLTRNMSNAKVAIDSIKPGVVAISSQPASNNDSPVSKAELLTALRRLPGWRSDRDLTENEWRELVRTARIFQRADIHSVQLAFEEYVNEAVNQTGNQFHDPILNTMLLVRVLFDLPERVKIDGPIYTAKRFPNEPNYEKEGGLNLAWPISWNGGRPKLLARFAGCHGIYNPYKEFLAHYGKYPFRELPNPDENTP